MTQTALRALRPRDALYRVADGNGLAVEGPTTDALRWRYRYGFAGKPKVLSLGTYPAVSLAEARRARDESRSLLAQGIDLGAVRKEAKQAAVEAVAVAADTFEAMALTGWRGRKWPK